MNNLDKIFNGNPNSFVIDYLEYLFTVLKNIDHQSIVNFIELLIDARSRGATIYFLGNGGSAATASHFANDISIGTNSYEKPFRAISLSDNNAIITALSNDYGYDEIFVRQLKILGRPGDLVVAISASGNSKNLIKAFDFAKTIHMKTIGITAFDGGILKKLADHSIHVPTEQKEYGPAEDAHMILDHLISAYLMRFVRLK